LGFALFAQGFWTAMLFRTLAGLGLAGTFLPGLKTLVDRISAKSRERAIAFYTATFSSGCGLSFFSAGLIQRRLGWPWAFAAAAIGAASALLIAAIALYPRKPEGHDKPHPSVLDFRPVLKNRQSMAYILTYTVHIWELFSLRSWTVAFLTYCVGLQSIKAGLWQPTTVSAIMQFAASLAAVSGAEIGRRLGQVRVAAAVMTVSGMMALGFGYAALLPYAAVVALGIVYAMFVQGESALLHTGAILSAAPEIRGATMALQSVFGFTAAAVSPVVVGIVLDATGGGKTPFSWGTAFAVMGVVVLCGPFFLKRAKSGLKSDPR